MKSLSSAGHAFGIVGVAALATATTLWAAPTTRPVDCSRKSLQEAIDGADDGDTIEIDGLCAGNVRIEGKRLALVGAAGAGPHGVTGVPSPDGTAVVAVVHSAGVRLEGIQVTNGSGAGVATVASTVELEDVRIADNGGDGLAADGASLVDGSGVDLVSNGLAGIRADAGSRAVCTECDALGNGFFAADARDGARIVLHDGVVNGDFGLRGTEGGAATLDCVEVVSAHGCSLNGPRRAAEALFGGSVSLRAIGDFHGQISAFDRAEVQLLGARQIDTGIPGFNLIDLFSNLLVTSLEDEDVIQQQSRLSESVYVDRFSRVVLEDESTLDGDVSCSAASDTWAGADVLFNAGATIIGCASATYP